MIRIRPVLHVISLLMLMIVLFMLAPLGIAAVNQETEALRAFGLTLILTSVLCAVLWRLTRSKGGANLRPREGFLMVSFSWIAASAAGALPFSLSGAVPSYTDAFFETMSGFTTTGASILTAIEDLPRSLLFWRSLTHWLGGMGIVVLTVAVLPFLGVGGVQLFRAESPGPTLDKIAPNMTRSAKILWIIYMGLTVLETVLLMFGGMDLFDALTHTFGTLATGGFSPRSASVGAYDSAYIDWVITIFMVMAGLNFVLYHKLISGKFGEVAGNTELRAYLVIFAASVLAMTLPLMNIYGGFGRALRFAGFQAASVITTTGYATADFDLWPSAAKAVLFFLMFVGGCSGSTGGGPKVIRLVAIFKLALNEMKLMCRPRGVFRIRLDGEPVKKDFLYPVAGFLLLYMFLLLAVTLAVCFTGTDLITGFTTALATVGNIGPGFGKIGPAGNYAFYAPGIKWLLSAAMLAGRLEVYTVLVLLTRSFWARR